MRRPKIRRIELILAAVSLVAAASMAEEPKSGVTWLDDWSQALATAQKDQRPILLEFYTAWCVYCGKLEKETFGDPRVIDLAKGFVCVRLDAEVAKGVATRYSPEGFPATIVAASNGDELIQINGFKNADTMLRVLAVMRDQGPKMSEWVVRIDKDAKDIEARESLGRTYLELGMADKAEEHLAAALKAKPPSEAGDGGESDQARIQFLLARAYAAGDDPQRAVKTLDALIASNPTSPKAPAYLLELARVHLAAGKKSKAKDAVALLEKSYGGTPEAETARTVLKAGKTGAGS